MLVYNIFIAIVAFLLYLDYAVHKYDVHLVNGGTRLTFGNTFMYLALGVIIFFAGFRFEIGYDYTKYLAGYIFDNELRNWEPLFNTFVRIIRQLNFGLDIQAMFLFFSALTTIILYMALKGLSQYYRFGILLYILVPALYLNSFSVIRQGLSLVILLYGLKYIAKENPEYKKYFFVALLAFLFHYSSIFVSLLFVLSASFFRKSHSWLLYSFGIVLSLFISFAHIGKFILASMPGHFNKYADYVGEVSILKLLLVNIFFLFFMIQKEKFIHGVFEKYLLNSIFIGLLIFNIFSDFIYVTRLAQYFLVAEIVLVPIYLYSLKDIVIRKIMMSLFLLYYLFNYDYALYRDANFGGTREHFLVPYKNYFFEEKKSYRNTNLEAWYNYIEESQKMQEVENIK